MSVTSDQGNGALAATGGGETHRPLIGLPGRRRTAAEIGGFPDTLGHLLVDVYLTGYADAVRAAGGLPVHLPVGTDPTDYAGRLDGILLTGGADIEPIRYGAEPDGAGHYEPERDDLELGLLAGALADGIPVLGVCRGLQLLNVCAGGTLVQDVPAHARYDVDPSVAVHRVSFDPDSLCARLYGCDIEVNSLHHQTVDRLGVGLVVAGRADDGTIEAVEMAGRDVLAVQWHPEMRPGLEPVFGWLVERARSHRAATSR